MLIAKSLQIITGLLGHAIRSFTVTALMLELLWALPLAIFSYWLAGGESITRSVIAAVICFGLSTICSLILAVYNSATSVVRKAVSDAGIGRTIFNNLFDRVLGVKGEDTGEKPEGAKVPTHMPASELRTKLNSAAEKILSEDASSTRWVGPFFWLAKRIQKICVWATVKVIVRFCSKEGDSVNVYHIRDQLASVIDEKIVAYLTGHYRFFATTAVTLLTIIEMLIPLGHPQSSRRLVI